MPRKPRNTKKRVFRFNKVKVSDKVFSSDLYYDFFVGGYFDYLIEACTHRHKIREARETINKFFKAAKENNLIEEG